MAFLDQTNPPARASQSRAASDYSVLQMIWLQKRLIVWSVAICLVFSFMYLLFAPRVYTATSRVLVQKAEPVLLNQQHVSDEGNNDNFLATQCELIRATPILAAVVGTPTTESMQTFNGVKNRMAYLKRNLGADVGKKDDIITISFSSKYPEEAVRIVDAAVDAYQKYCSSKKRDTANEVMSILEKEKAKNETELSAVNQKIIELKRASHTISFGNDKSNYALTRLNSLSDALTTAHLETINSKTALDAAAKTIGSDAESIPDNLAGGIALSLTDEASLRAQLVSLTQLLQDRRRIYLPDHPQVKSLEARINQLNMAYVGAAKVRWEQAKSREAELQKSYEQEQAAAIDLSAKAAEAAQLESDAKRIQETIDGLETRIKDISLVVDSGSLNITVLEFASYEDNPIKPSKAQVPAVALVIGLIIGCCIAVTREASDPKMHNADDVKHVVPAPVLGMVPRQSPAGTPSVLGQIVELDPHSEVAEAMRAVRTSLSFGVAPENARSIVVTSPEPDDGKTTVASNLAIALANAGKRVLLIDGDLRNSSIHHIFGINNEYGFSSLLSDKEDPDCAIVRCSVARLGLMPSGPAPESASELLNDPAFPEMLSKLYNHYDHVVIDSPPILPVDDARIMAALCDCTVLVARAEKTSKSILRQSADRLVDVGAFIAGVVLNGGQGGTRYGRYGTTKDSTASENKKLEAPRREPEIATVDR
jgi:capsular exopolysaccharide synthesis family protein